MGPEPYYNLGLIQSEPSDPSKTHRSSSSYFYAKPIFYFNIYLGKLQKSHFFLNAVYYDSNGTGVL